MLYGLTPENIIQHLYIYNSTQTRYEQRQDITNEYYRVLKLSSLRRLNKMLSDPAEHDSPSEYVQRWPGN